MEELKRFEEDLKNSEELRRKFEEAVKRQTEGGEAESDGDAVVRAAKELGYDISIATLDQAKAEAETLDPEALDEVAGGAHLEACPAGADYACTSMQRNVDDQGHDASCWVTWHCSTTFRHTDTKSKKIACWSDYMCMYINHPIEI